MVRLAEDAGEADEDTAEDSCVHPFPASSLTNVSSIRGIQRMAWAEARSKRPKDVGFLAHELYSTTRSWLHQLFPDVSPHSIQGFTRSTERALAALRALWGSTRRSPCL